MRGTQIVQRYEARVFPSIRDMCLYKKEEAIFFRLITCIQSSERTKSSNQ